MSKLIIMRGLPASGKSTQAKEIMDSSRNTVRLNKDLLRTMLHFDKFNGKNEEMTMDTELIIAKMALLRDINVIVDDTNLNPKVFNTWCELAKECECSHEVVEMTTSMDDCIERDNMREKKVGRDVIVKMALQYNLYPEPKKGFVLCDLDGTLCDITHRLHFVKQIPKDWKGFFDGISGDKLREDVVDMLMDYEGSGYDIIFVTARPEKYRETTEKWLERNFGGYEPQRVLIMRPENDKRPDTEVKKSMLDKYFPNKSKIHTVIDDRPSVIRMWEEQGLHVIDVGQGVEF